MELDPEVPAGVARWLRLEQHVDERIVNTGVFAPLGPEHTGVLPAYRPGDARRPGRIVLRYRKRSSSAAFSGVTKLLRLCAPLLLASATACGGLYQQPLYLPAAPTAFVDTFLLYRLAVFEGSRAPMPVLEAHARCEDESVCTTVISTPEGSRLPELRILPTGLGTSKVVVDFVHPGTKQAVTHRMSVRFVPAPPSETLALGHVPPGTGVPIVHMSTPPLRPSTVVVPFGRCVQGSAYEREIVGSGQDDVALFDCVAPVEADANRLMFRRCEGSCAAIRDERYSACVRIEGGRVASITMFQVDDDGSLRERMHEGERHATACTLRDGGS